MKMSFLFVKTVSFIILLFFSHLLYAEYYFVPQGDPAVIWLEGSNHHVVKKKYVKKKYHRTYVQKRKPTCAQRRADVLVYYVNYTPSCCLCQEVWVQGRWDCYSAYIPVRTDWRVYDSDYIGYRYEAYDAWYPSQVEITYNPDLTTGDDDTWVDPNMNING